jgi:SAM-dependent methyltransferase
MALLRCPDCQATLRETGDGWRCTGCDAHGIVDAAGVLHLDLGPSGGAATDPAERIDLSPEVSAAEAPTRISEAIRARAPSPTMFWNYLSSFLPNPAGFAILGATHTGTRSLVLSSGWGNLPRVIASLGGQVVAMDSLHEGLVYTRLHEQNGSMGCVCSSLRLPLPFADDVFDSVFLDDLATGAGYEEQEGPVVDQSRKGALLRECTRILRPGGYAVLLTWNRMSPLGNAPRPDLGRTPLATKPARATKAGFAGLLRASGFDPPRCFVPWPDHSTWHSMVADSDLEDAHLTLEGGSWKRRFAQVALDLSAQLGLAEHLAPSHCFVARTPLPSNPGHPAPPASTLDVIANAVGVEPDSVRRLDSHANSNCLSFRTVQHFVKIPLTRDAAARIANASRVLDDAPAHMVEDGFIVAPLPEVEADGIPLGVYPLVPHDNPNTEWPDKVARVQQALDRLDADRLDIPLGRTDFWRRLMEDQAREEFRRISPDLEVFGRLAHLEAKTVPSGLVHGDLAWGNLIRDREDRVRLIDWDRCERRSPRFLDTVHACHSLARTHHFLKYPESAADRILGAWASILNRNPEIPLLDRIDDVRGQLGWKDAVSLTILNEIDQHHRSLRENPILRDAHHETLQNRLRLVLGTLGDNA